MIDRKLLPAITDAARAALQSVNEFIRVQQAGRTPLISDELMYEFVVRRRALRQLLHGAGCFDQHRVTVYPLEGAAHAAMLTLAAEVGVDGDSPPPQIEAFATRLTEVVRVLEGLQPAPPSEPSPSVEDTRVRELVAEMLTRKDATNTTVTQQDAPAVLQPAARETPPPVSEQPRKLLTGWREIAAALDMPYSDADKIKSLNQRFKGPIVIEGQGTSPMVYRDDLIHWWNRLAIQAEELANQRDGARLSAEAQHAYGKEGTAAPEIKGEVKKRRSDRKPT